VLDELGGRVDRWQRRRSVPGFVVAVLKRFGEDRGPLYAAAITYHGFFSLFPLLLVFVTVLGFVLDDHPELREDLLDSAFGRIPVVGAQLEQNITGLQASGAVLVIGLLLVLWQALAVIDSLQDALHGIWDIPRYERPGLVPRRLRGLAVLAALGGFFVLATAIGTLLPRVADLGVVTTATSAVLAVAVNVGFVLTTFTLLVVGGRGWRALLPGAVLAGVALYLLQALGALYVERVVGRASDLYGTFAVVLGLLVWINLLSFVFLFAAEVDVVRDRRLWPRSLTGRDPTDADEQAFAGRVERERPAPPPEG
jgi:inner membrane protein YhjD